MTTELLYESAADRLEATASLIEVRWPPEIADPILVLDRTPFYPQGGGQPSDVGTIEGEGFRFAVDKVLLEDGIALHFGTLRAGEVTLGYVRATVDGAWRAEASRLHSGGHLAMAAMLDVTGLEAVKGFHFPSGPYVEFDGNVPAEERERVVAEVQGRLDEMIVEDSPILVERVSPDQLRQNAAPAGRPAAGKSARVVTTCGHACPCGGTHVSATGELTGLRVKSIKTKSGRARLSYTI